MGYQIRAIDDSNTKPNYQAEIIAAPDFADGMLGLFIGDATIGRDVPLFSGFMRCLQRIREEGWPNPSAGNFNTVVFSTQVSTIKTVVLNGAIPVLNPDDICLIQGSGFTVSHDSNTGHIRRMIEAMKERYLGNAPFRPSIFDLVFEFDIAADNLDLTIPFIEGQNYDCFISWGDGEGDEIKAWDDPALTHTYAGAGTYEVRIAGTVPTFAFGSYNAVTGSEGGDLRLVDIKQWGDTGLRDCTDMFILCQNLNISATDVPNLSGVTSCVNMFMDCNALDGYNLETWNVSTITDFTYFLIKTSGNTGDMIISDADFSAWDVSNVVSTNAMFQGCDSYIGNGLGSWNVGNLEDGRQMFNRCSALNTDLSAWRPVKLSQANSMFSQCTAFNSDLSGWTPNDLQGGGFDSMFFNASAFTGIGLELWDYTNIEYNVVILFGLRAFCDNTAIAPAQYDLMLANWASQASEMPTNNMLCGMAGVQFTAAGQADRDTLTNTYNWVITDGGVAP